MHRSPHLMLGYFNDLEKTGGENVASREVEEMIYRLPAVSEVAVIGLPDPKGWKR